MFDMRPYRNNNDRRNNLSAYNPFREMDAFERNFFNDPFGSWFDHSALASFKTDIKDNGDSYTLEASFGSYSRQFDLSSVDADHMKATYDNGVLKLEMPKKALPDSARHIEIE